MQRPHPIEGVSRSLSACLMLRFLPYSRPPLGRGQKTQCPLHSAFTVLSNITPVVFRNCAECALCSKTLLRYRLTAIFSQRPFRARLRPCSSLACPLARCGRSLCVRLPRLACSALRLCAMSRLGLRSCLRVPPSWQAQRVCLSSAIRRDTHAQARKRQRSTQRYPSQRSARVSVQRLTALPRDVPRPHNPPHFAQPSALVFPLPPTQRATSRLRVSLAEPATPPHPSPSLCSAKRRADAQPHAAARLRCPLLRTAFPPHICQTS